MSDAVTLSPCTDPAVWNELVLRQPGGTAFHEWSFIDLAERLTGFRVERLLVSMSEPVGVLPVVRRSAGSPIGEWMPFPYFGPAVPAELLGATLRAARRWQWRHRLVLGRFDLAPALADVVHVAADSAGMLVEDDSTLVLDVSHGSMDQVYAGMSARRRQYIRAADRKGVESRPALPGETAALLGRVLDSAYRRHGAEPPYPADVGAQFEAWAAGRDDVIALTSSVDGEPVGVSIGMGWHPVALNWVGAVLPEAQSSHANDLQYRDLVAWSIDRGHAVFDLVGRVDDAVERYKRTLGAHSVPYARVVSLLAPRVVTRWIRARRSHARAAAA